MAGFLMNVLKQQIDFLCYHGFGEGEIASDFPEPLPGKCRMWTFRPTWGDADLSSMSFGVVGPRTEGMDVDAEPVVKCFTTQWICMGTRRYLKIRDFHTNMLKKIHTIRDTKSLGTIVAETANKLFDLPTTTDVDLILRPSSLQYSGFPTMGISQPWQAVAILLNQIIATFMGDRGIYYEDEQSVILSLKMGYGVSMYVTNRGELRLGGPFVGFSLVSEENQLLLKAARILQWAENSRVELNDILSSESEIYSNEYLLSETTSDDDIDLTSISEIDVDVL